jgi:hypothetical protein
MQGSGCLASLVRGDSHEGKKSSTSCCLVSLLLLVTIDKKKIISQKIVKNQEK